MVNSEKSKARAMKLDENVEEMQKSTTERVNRLDVTADVCPMTFVRTKLALEKLAGGALLEVLLRDGEARDNVPRSVQAEGNHVLEVCPAVDRPGCWRVVIRKRGDGGTP